ncbi:TPA: hypothetical protein SJ157_000044 [Yersinia enterocolitica]|nr:hypothetical protein [Yersinia enterocolitica]
MNEKPILFNSEMVNAILSGRKTQTRRIIKLDHERGMVNPVVRGRNGEISSITCRLAPMLCPLGQPGDQLWVRETFGKYRAAPLGFVYRADGELPCGDPERWTPSIHMPRWASRINLLITSVRVERLQDISDADASAEGCKISSMQSGECLSDMFARLWKSIYGDESWQANPWVWVINFERMEAK